jgi:uncharacterized protein (TIGR02246 family)
LFASISSTTAAAGSDQAAIEAVEARQAAAWNAHDAAAYADLFTPDGDVVNVIGWWWKGREEIRRKLTDAFASVFKDSRLAIAEVAVRKLSPDIALAHVRWTMTGALAPPGEPMPPQAGMQLQVLVRGEDGWRIASFQNTSSRPERPFAKPGAQQAGTQQAAAQPPSEPQAVEQRSPALQASGQPAAEPATANQSVADYQSLTVQQFSAEGVKLAGAHAKVSITGAYILQDGRDTLYPDVQAIIKMKYSHSPNAPVQPTVPLLVNEASAHFRRMALACQTDPSASKVGCTIKIRGKAMLCPVPDASGESREVPCISVEDGK